MSNINSWGLGMMFDLVLIGEQNTHQSLIVPEAFIQCYCFGFGHGWIMFSVHVRRLYMKSLCRDRHTSVSYQERTFSRPVANRRSMYVMFKWLLVAKCLSLWPHRWCDTHSSSIRCSPWACEKQYPLFTCHHQPPIWRIVTSLYIEN